jgi:membrane protein DedA with SNARE-associated domain
VVSTISIPPHLGYLAVLALVGGESAGVPVPGETALSAAALLARHGPAGIRAVIIVAAAAAMAGDNIGYLIGRTAGRALLERPGLLERHRRPKSPIRDPPPMTATIARASAPFVPGEKGES